MPSSPGDAPTVDSAALSIGEVLAVLTEEFPDVTISKIRFLESQGLVEPDRNASGYRQFHDADIERLRWILRQQRDHFLPLKVIRRALERGVDVIDAGAGDQPTLWTAVAEAAAAEEVERRRSEIVESEAADARRSAARSAAHPTRARSAPSPGSGSVRRRRRVDGQGPRYQTPADVVAALQEAPEVPGSRSEDPEGDAVPDADGRPAQMGDSVDESAPGGGPGSAGADADPAEGATGQGGYVNDDPDQGGSPEGHSPEGHSSEAEMVEPTGTERGDGPTDGHPETGGNDQANTDQANTDQADTDQADTEPTDTQQRGTDPVLRPGDGSGGAGPVEAEGPGDRGDAKTVGSAEMGVDRQANMEGSMRQLSRDELIEEVGISAETLDQLADFGLVDPVDVAGELLYGSRDIEIANLAKRGTDLGLTPRHLRIYKVAADRESGLLEQVAMPLLKQRNPAARERAAATVAELAEIGAALHAALLAEELGPNLAP